MLLVALEAAYDIMPLISLLTFYAPSFLPDKVTQSIFRKQTF